MSRTWRPYEAIEMYKMLGITSISQLQGKWTFADGTEQPLFTDDEIAYGKKYVTFGMAGPSVLGKLVEKHWLSDEAGEVIVQQVEDILNNKPVDDPELVEITQKWYKGELVGDYYMEADNEEFASFLIKKIKQRRTQTDD